MTRVLVTGIAGGLAQRVAERLLVRGDSVVGLDYRSVGTLPDALTGMTVLRASYNKTGIEDVFRKQRIDRVLHLGRVGNLKESPGKRFDLNVVGTQKIMNLCVQYGVSRLVVLSTFHIYGAHPANHIPISEEEPVRAGFDFPQLADAIQLDNMASTWVYQHPETSVCLLRPTNVIGPRLRNTMSDLLRAPRIPKLLGFDPMTQFLHQDDLADVIVRAAESTVAGVFNVAGETAIPWSAAIRLAGASAMYVPAAFAGAVARVTGGAPTYLLDFLKYPCVISDAKLRSALGWAPEVSVREAIEGTVAGRR